MVELSGIEALTPTLPVTFYLCTTTVLHNTTPRKQRN